MWVLNRPAKVETFFSTAIIQSSILLMLPFGLLCLVGYTLAGARFFSVQYWLSAHGIWIPPTVAIISILGVFLLVIATLADLLLARGSYIGIFKQYLLIKKRIKYPISEIDIQSVRLCESNSLFICFRLKDKSRKEIRYSLIFSNLMRAQENVELLKSALCDVERQALEMIEDN